MYFSNYNDDVHIYLHVGVPASAWTNRNGRTHGHTNQGCPPTLLAHCVNCEVP